MQAVAPNRRICSSTLRRRQSDDISAEEFNLAADRSALEALKYQEEAGVDTDVKPGVRVWPGQREPPVSSAAYRQLRPAAALPGANGY